MVSKKKREQGRDNYNKGNDAEDWARIKAQIQNPLKNVEASPKPNSPYDYSMEDRDFVRQAKRVWKKL